MRTGLNRKDLPSKERLGDILQCSRDVSKHSHMIHHAHIVGGNRFKGRNEAACGRTERNVRISAFAIFLISSPNMRSIMEFLPSDKGITKGFPDFKVTDDPASQCSCPGVPGGLPRPQSYRGSQLGSEKCRYLQ